jgi:zinc-ribbon domain
MDGLGYAVIAISFGLAAGLVGRSKGSSFLIWFVVGAVIPFFGLIAAFLFRNERAEPERQCPTCGKALKLYVQVCPRCGTDLYLPAEDEPIRQPPG